MDALSYIQSDIPSLASTFEVWEKAEDGSLYDNGWQQDGTADVHVFNPSSQQQVTIEGTGEVASFTGLTTVSRDANGNIIHDVEVGQQLRLNGQQYDVVAKVGVPSDHDPAFWRLGLNQASQSQ